jgi:hypothetical protein
MNSEVSRSTTDVHAVQENSEHVKPSVGPVIRCATAFIEQ